MTVLSAKDSYILDTPARRLRRLIILFALISLCGARRATADQFNLKIIAFNDFHGNLRSPGKMRANAQSPDVPVGGADELAGYIAYLKAQNPNHIVVAAGDIIGASPLTSNLFHDEDTVEAMNRAGLEISSVGNHEFDHGLQELLRIQKGGCSTKDPNSCEGAQTGTPVPFEGARYHYLGANVIAEATGKSVLPAYAIRSFQGVPVAFIGITLKETASMVSPNGIVGLRFADEATTINSVVSNLEKQGVRSFVVLIHQGGYQSTKGPVDINGCEGGLAGYPIKTIVSKLDDAVDLVISAHTHAAYVCEIPNSVGRNITVTSAQNYGRILTDIDATIDTETKKITRVAAHNILVDRTNPQIVPNAMIAAIVNKYADLAAPLDNRVVGSLKADVTNTENEAGETPLGELVADSQLEATRVSQGAVIAFMNRSGIRAPLVYLRAGGDTTVAPGNVTYGDLFSVQPFANNLVTMNLTGSQIKTLLEEQFKGCALDSPPGDPPQSQEEILQVSRGFTYSWNAAAPTCSKVDPQSIKLNGDGIVPKQSYRVTTNSFLAEGGSQMYEFTKGTNRVSGELDLDALIAYFGEHPSLSPPSLDRITVSEAADSPTAVTNASDSGPKAR